MTRLEALRALEEARDLVAQEQDSAEVSKQSAVEAAAAVGVTILEESP